MDIEYKEKFDKYVEQLKRAVDDLAKGKIQTAVVEKPFRKLFMFGLTVGDSVLIYTSESPLSGEHYPEENLFPGWNNVPFSSGSTLTLSVKNNKVYVYRRSALWLEKVPIDGWEDKEVCDIVVPESEMIHIKRSDYSETVAQAIADICHKKKNNVIIRCDDLGISFLCAMRLKRLAENKSSTFIYEGNILKPCEDDIFGDEEDLTLPPIMPVEMLSMSAVYNGKKCILIDKLLLTSIPKMPPIPFVNAEEYEAYINSRCFVPQIKKLYNSLEVLESTAESKNKYEKEQVNFPDMKDINIPNTDNFVLLCMAKITPLRAAVNYYFDKKKLSFLKNS